MINQSFSEEALWQKFEEGVKTFQFEESTINRHLRHLKRLFSYMSKMKLTHYTPIVGQQFLLDIYSDEKKTCYYKQTSHATIRLLNIILQGLTYTKEKTSEYPFHGDIGEIAKAFIEYLVVDERLSPKTIVIYRRILSLFTQRLELERVSLHRLNEDAILSFVSSRNSQTQFILHIRRFLAYMHDNGYTNKDFSILFGGVRPIRKEKLPSYYDIADITKLEKSVERTSAVGKRDYAIILLATRLGLRSSDICGLMFSNLNWDNSLIRLQQYKTKRYITLPLLSEVGDALIDYIRHGRPDTNLKNVFLTSAHPYRRLSASGLSAIVARYFMIAGIYCKGKHYGPHALRHSLATILLTKGTSLPVISEILGHGNTESTMYYLGVNINALMECSLDVPPIDDAFYTQVGGMFYE